MIWDGYNVEWYVDGELKRRSTKFYSILGQTLDCNDLKANSLYLLNEGFPADEMNIIFNLAIENGKNSPNKSTPFPLEFIIDYIKFYTQKP